MKRLFILLFIIINCSAFADTLFNTTIQNGCADVYDNKMRFESVFAPTVYNCSSGTFLPANALSCEQCPNGWICSGGEYTFNENIAQGIVFNDTVNTNISNTCSTNIRFFEPVWTPTQYNCSAGYYLPADATSCAECPQNNKCTGGTYTFNETTNQGIEPCPSNTPHAPTGSAVCYPHILHIGENNVYLKSTKLTTPSLNIAIEGSIFYANLTTTPTYMNKASEQSLKIMVNGVEYYVCDDTSCPQ